MLYKSHCIYITKTIRLMLFRKTIYVYFKNYAKQINTLCGENTKFLYVKLDSVCAFLPLAG